MKQILNNRILQLGLVLFIGLFLGWLIFRSDKTSHSEHQHEQGESSTFTCSMHPQIRQSEPGKCPICGMDLIPLTQRSTNGESGPFVISMSPEAIALANVQTQKVKTGSPVHDISLTGKVAVNEQLISVITANYPGRIEKLYVDFTGQTVDRGQLLATIYSPELITAQKELIEASKFKDINAALYNASKEKLRLWKISEKQIAAIESGGVVLTEFEVFADQSGVVVRRDIAKGDYVNKGTVLFEIADLNTVWILLDAYESDLPFMKVGQKVTFTLTSNPGNEFSSTIAFIDPFINPQTRTAAVRAEISNPRQLLKPEMFVKGTIRAGITVSGKSIVIPNTSLLWTGKRSVVYVKVPDTELPAFEMREINLGASLGAYYIVNGGLSEGEEIVTNGVFSIDGAAQLSGNYSMMNRATDNTIAVPDQFAGQLSAFVLQYFELKNSLVKSNFQQSKTDARRLLAALDKIDMKLLQDEAHAVWMQHYTKLKKTVGAMQSVRDIDNLRSVFSALSDQVVETAETFRLNISTVYITFCPMALDNKGAYWLSETEVISNPYFGEKMLKCGEIRKKISGRELSL